MTPLRDLFLLRPEIVFLNHGSFGACPKPVFEVYQNWQIELEREPVEFLGRRFAGLMQEARGSLSEFLGTQRDNLIFVPNATTGLNLVARSLPLQPGDEVLATNQEYGAIDRVWQFICQKRGGRYVRQPLTLPVRSAAELVDEFWQGVTDRTRVILLSHITSVTALILPIEKIIARAKSAGLLVVIDGAHTAGQLPLDLDSLSVDFYAGNCHKWMMAPKGAGFLYVHPDRQSLISPLVISWGDKSLADSAYIQENEYQGTLDIAAYLTISDVISFMKNHNWPAEQERCHRLVRRARLRLAEITGLEPLCQDSEVWFRQMLAHPLPNLDGEKLHQRLFNEFGIEIPVNEINGEQFIRISAQGYNSDADVDTFLTAFEKLIAEMVH